MDNEEKNELAGFDLESLTTVFQEAAAEADPRPAEPAPEASAPQAAAQSAADDSAILTEMLRSVLNTPDAAEAAALFEAAAGLPDEAPAPAAPEMPEEPEVPAEPAEEAAASPAEPAPEPAPSPAAAPASGTAQTAPTATQRRIFPGNSSAAAAPRPVPAYNAALRELKRKVIAGPEKKYYSLSEQGITGLQIAILVNALLLLAAAAGIVLFTMGSVPKTREKLLIFSQVLAMLVSGLLGCQILIDGAADLFRLRYSLSSTLFLSFLACIADAWFCLDQRRVPCCAVFILVMETALIARYERRSTELSQLDTMRKASRLIGLAVEPNYMGKRAGLLRTQGDVEDFMDTYQRISTPELLQRIYAVIALLVCIGISVLTGVLHSPERAAQVLSISLLATVPAGYYLALTRPMAVLSKRLHMVGAVICGWDGVRKLCGRAVVPILDRDLFPQGSVKLNGVKYYSERPQSEIVSYSASLIFSAGGCLVPLFRSLLTSRNGVSFDVEEYRNYGSGGIGGIVNGEPVLLGSADFLRQMGVEIPEGAMVSQAIYVSIDGELCSVIAVSFSRMRSAAAGLLTLCSRMRLRPTVLTNDFMLSEAFLRSKFNVRTRRLQFPDRAAAAELLEKTPAADAQVLALLSRDELIASAYAVSGAMSLRSACRMASFINLIGGIVSAFIIGSLVLIGDFSLLSPANVLIYQAIWLLPTLLAGEWTRRV